MCYNRTALYSIHTMFENLVTSLDRVCQTSHNGKYVNYTDRSLCGLSSSTNFAAISLVSPLPSTEELIRGTSKTWNKQEQYISSAETKVWLSAQRYTDDTATV